MTKKKTISSRPCPNGSDSSRHQYPRCSRQMMSSLNLACSMWNTWGKKKGKIHLLSNIWMGFQENILNLCVLKVDKDLSSSKKPKIHLKIHLSMTFLLKSLDYY